MCQFCGQELHWVGRLPATTLFRASCCMLAHNAPPLFPDFLSCPVPTCPSSLTRAAARPLPPACLPALLACGRIPLRISLTFSLLEGTMCAWLPPPPGNRLFYSFVTPPNLELTARPEVSGESGGDNVSPGRPAVRWAHHVVRQGLNLKPDLC